MNDTITVRSVVAKHSQDLNTQYSKQSCAELVSGSGKGLIWKDFQKKFFLVAPTVLLCRLEVHTGVVQGDGVGNHRFNITMAMLGLGDYELELRLICNEYLHYFGAQTR